MRNMSRRKKNNIIIACLCGVLLLMAIGYAAFQSQIKIKVTSSISGIFNIQITNIETMLPSESGGGIPDGYNISEPTYTPSSATFSAGFELPGSMIAYIVEVSNLGSIDGQVGIGNLSCGDNSAIMCQAMATDENQTNGFEFQNGSQDYSDIYFALKSGEKHYIFVMVGYADVTEQPDDLNTNIKLDLTYEQYVDPILTGEAIYVGNQLVNIAKSGDGLYKDEYEDGRYAYKGTDPDNYIMFNDELWRIISIESDDSIKIIKNEYELYNMSWDYNNVNKWDAPASLNTYLNTNYLSTLSDTDKIIQHSWNIGPVIRNNDDLITQIANEKETQWSGKVGLITVSEYLRANTNLQNCATFKLNNENVDECSVTNWLTMSTTYWLISAEYDSSAVWRISMDSSITNNAPNYTPSPSSVVPSVYLTPSITLQGTGTKENPFVIIS